MNTQEILATLQKLGKPQTASIYKRHGTGGNVFGVLTSEIGKLQKKIKVDHALTPEMWKTGNAEARVLALQVADPERLTLAGADRLLQDGPVRFVGCYLAGLLVRSPIAKATMRGWMNSPDELTREMGYGIRRPPEGRTRLGQRRGRREDTGDDRKGDPSPAELGPQRDERRAHLDRRFKPALRQKAIEAARRIGKVEVDHGATSCKTPDAVSCIEKASQRKRCP